MDPTATIFEAVLQGAWGICLSDNTCILIFSPFKELTDGLSENAHEKETCVDQSSPPKKTSSVTKGNAMLCQH